MTKSSFWKSPFRNPPANPLAAAFACLTMLLLLAAAPATAQEITVTGTVTSTSGQPVRDVTVLLLGTETRAMTDALGRYRIEATPNGTLLYSKIGQRPYQTAVNGRTTIDVTMEPVAFLEEIVVTAYAEQRRADITGAVASVNVEAAERQTSASVLQRLEGNVSGVRVENSGSPGSRSTVRIRGISSFQNNDPLYIVDGVPVQDDYINWLNPNDVTSIQVLKDASAASIYGSRASNGVIIIETTRKGAAGPPRVTFRAQTGIATPVRGYDDFLITDALEYYEVVKRSYLNAGFPIDSVPRNIYGDPRNPTVPQYIWPNNCGPNATPGPCSTVDLDSYSYPTSLIMPGSRGTNWWDAVFGTGMIGDYNVDIAGGSDASRYNVSFNYFKQDGTAEFNEFNRGSVRVNTQFDVGRLTFGENMALAHDWGYGGIGNDDFGEGNILGKNILMQPVVPVYDARGNFASGKAVGLGNNTNPLKYAEARKDNVSRNTRLFGNVFGGVALMDQLNFRTSFGFNLGRWTQDGFNPITPENSEPTFTNSIFENANDFTDWTWTNTLRYALDLDRHNVSLLLGQEANRNTNRFVTAGAANVISDDPNSRYLQDALIDASTKNVSSIGGESTLLSYFGRGEYTFDDRYLVSFTLRRDGSSRLSPDHRWGTFPAVGLGWRIRNEPFMQDVRFFSDLMLRFGWGITGNQAIPSGRIISQFGGGRGDTYYDIGGTDNSLVAGFRQTSLGNRDLRWEESRSVNVGVDAGMLDGALQVVLDVYQRTTDDLLFDPSTPGTAGVAAPPIVNIGEMENRGFDVSVSWRQPNWSVTFNGSHYRNEIVRIDGEREQFAGPITTRFGNQVMNRVGHPIGAFYGYRVAGFFQSQAEAAAATLNAAGQCPSSFCQDGAAPGRFRFQDINGDGRLTLADRTIIGDPHPDFTAGLDVTFNRGPFDLSATLFGTFGNDIFDVQKEFYVFRNFSTNVRRDLLTDSWTPENPDAKYPILDINDNFSRALSDFYVEDGSYVRLRNVQLGYTLPADLVRWTSTARVYLQIENLFTITGYDGLDPALPAANSFGPAGDIRDQYRGVDRGVYPSSRTYSIGLTTSF